MKTIEIRLEAVELQERWRSFCTQNEVRPSAGRLQGGAEWLVFGLPGLVAHRTQDQTTKKGFWI
jgi:hypothetical protein